MGRIYQRTACRALSAAALLALICFIVAGCGGGSSAGKAIAEGKVTYKGKPVTGGTINFIFESGAFPGQITPDGGFRVPNLPTGKATVTVSTQQLRGKGYMPAFDTSKIPASMKDMLASMKKAKEEGGGAAAAGTYVEIPRKYERKDTSPLTWDLTAGENHKDLTLEP
jgi:hypothetical protein